MKLVKHLASQPFIVATGIAALVHSTWSIATFFSGPEPAQHFSWEWFGWALVAFLIAFSMDIGQIVTSAEIREGKRSIARYTTFGIFALGTWYAQFLYISSHMPAVPMALGMRSEWAGVAQFLRDAAVFILPALLPASTLLYTFSSGHIEAAHLPSDAKSLTISPIEPIIVERPVQEPQPTIAASSAVSVVPVAEPSAEGGSISLRRRCAFCRKLLPEDARSSRKFCDSACRAAMHSRSDSGHRVEVAEPVGESVV